MIIRAWCLLAVVICIANAQSLLNALYTFILLLVFFAIMVILVRPLLGAMASRVGDTKPKYNLVMIIFIAIFICALITEIIGVQAICKKDISFKISF